MTTVAVTWKRVDRPEAEYFDEQSAVGLYSGPYTYWLISAPWSVFSRSVSAAAKLVSSAAPADVPSPVTSQANRAITAHPNSSDTTRTTAAI
jgi:hypothetical protein